MAWQGACCYSSLHVRDVARRDTYAAFFPFPSLMLFLSFLLLASWLSLVTQWGDRNTAAYWVALKYFRTGGHRPWSQLRGSSLLGSDAVGPHLWPATASLQTMFSGWSFCIRSAIRHRNKTGTFRRSQWPRSLRCRSWSLGCWDRGFESHVCSRIFITVLK
jgi:hypothetical protein